MKIPMELLLERLAYLKPRVKLPDRGIWVSGVRMLPTRGGKISKEYVYFGTYADFDWIEEGLILIAVVPPGAPDPERERFILLETEEPLSDIINDLLGLEALLQHWERDMIQAMGSGPSLQRLLELSEPVLGNPILVLDPAFRTLGCTRSFETDNVVFRELSELGYLTQETFNSLKEHGYFTEDHYTGETLILPPSELKDFTSTLTAILDGTTVRYLVLMLCCNVECTPGLLALFRFLLEKIRICLAQMDDVIGEQREQYEYFLLDLLEKREMGPEEIEERGRCFLQMRKEHYNCVVIRLNRSTDMYRKHAQLTLRNLCAEWEPIIYKDTILLAASLGNRRLMEYFDTQSQLERLSGFLEHADARAGISNQFSSYEGFREASQQGIAALELGRKLEREEGNLYWYADYAVFQFLTVAGERLGLQTMLNPLLTEITGYDQAHHTEYLAILEAFLRNERNYTNTARELHMHRNNVIYHMKRMYELFSFQLDDPELRLQLNLSYRVLRLLQPEA